MTTQRYVELHEEIYGNNYADQFITKIASDKQERIDLINDGWSLFDKEGVDWYFRKPK